MRKLKIITFLLILVGLTSCTSYHKDPTKNTLYLNSIKEDFLKHRLDVITIYDINKKIVLNIDSLFTGSRKDTFNTNLTKGIMNTRAYTLTILAYKNILNGDYVEDNELKIKIARHVAQFEGLAMSKRSWDAQWDMTARPYLYKNGLSSKPENKTRRNNLISDPEFRAVLWDRRMFAHDVEIWTPRILNSADSIITTIDRLLND